MITAATLTIPGCKPSPVNETTDGYPVYHGNDLGVQYTKERTCIRIWAPSAEAIYFHIYDQGGSGNLLETHELDSNKDGTWTHILKGDYKNRYYTFQAKIDGQWKNEVADPYARAVGVNGHRGMIIDLPSTNPEGWENDTRPPLKSFTDMVIWEIHVRDFSIHPSSGSNYPGKFLAFTETGTLSPEGEKTGIDHLKELGITHVHLLPAFDFHTIDETRLHEPQYNWGYDPQNFNVPEGSYSTDPFDGNVRIREFKKMIQSLHNHGIRVIMDVVYNHVHNASTSNFEQLVPGYFFRMTDDGLYANGSGCGNETASEKAMMRKFIVESVKYWATEYKVDGFRFDLMGLHDIETMKLIRAELNKIDPTIFIYGEGWTAGDTPLPTEHRATKAHAARLDGVAVFSDDIRDGIRGPWWKDDAPGFITGMPGLEESIKFGVVASTEHPQIQYSAVNYSKAFYASNPMQTITYVTCHDNPCLWDKIVNTCVGCKKQDMLDLQKLANAIVLTSQGVSFLHAGEEIVRTKLGHHNTYNLPDSVNQLVWSNKAQYKEVFNYYQALIALRKNHPAFRMTETTKIQKHLRFFEFKRPFLVGFQITDHANGDQWKDILVFYNANPKNIQIPLPAGEWVIVATKEAIEEKGFTAKGYGRDQSGTTILPARSIMILVDKKSI